MRRISICFAACLLLASRSGSPQTAAEPHVVLAAEDLKFEPAPPVFPPGMTAAILSGDPSQSGPYAVRARMPAGYRVPPHWHPTAEHLTILSGQVAFGMGDRFDEASMKTLGAGGYAVMPAEMRHYVKATTEAVLEVHAMGPLVINYVNPADDPRNGAAKK
jgi:quercetin dioxygenase-like cupin family protein